MPTYSLYFSWLIDKTDKIEKLLKKGLSYGFDFFYEEDFFDLLDDWEIPQNRPIAIWGMGKIGHRFLENHTELEIKYIQLLSSSKELLKNNEDGKSLSNGNVEKINTEANQFKEIFDKINIKESDKHLIYVNEGNVFRSREDIFNEAYRFINE